MPSAIIHTFRAGEQAYDLRLLIEHDAIQLESVSGESLLTFEASSRVLDARGCYGRLCLECQDGRRTWVFYENHSSTRLVFYAHLLDTQVEIARRWVSLQSLRSGTSAMLDH